MRIKSALAALLASVALTVPALAAVSPTQIAKCYADAVAAGLKNILSLPGNAAYESSVSSYWANSQLRPWLIAQPRSATELSVMIKIIGAIPNLQFAVRSGGHMNWLGANNIQNGVTIDLSKMDSVAYDSNTGLASIGPGGHWKNVYASLHENGVVVAGGRDGNVGVAGFLLGGGNSYYATRTGLACNTVKNFEVVLANGKIVNANQASNPDLYLALKGGSNNLGLVTRFDMEAWPATDFWGGNIFYNRTASDDILDSFTTLTATANQNLDTAFVGLYTYTPAFKDIVTIVSLFNIDGVADPPLFDDFRSIQPQIDSALGPISMAEAARTMYLPPGEYSTWFTMTYQNDATLSKFMAAKHAELVDYLRTQIPDGDFTTQVVFQTFPTAFVKAGVAAGGNVLGLEKSIPQDAVLLLFTSSLHTTAQRDLAYKKMKTLFADMQNQARQAKKLYDFQYLNYADPSQNPLASYGKDNVAKIKAAAQKYDPSAFFQKRLPGGWKISKVV